MGVPVLGMAILGDLVHIPTGHTADRIGLKAAMFVPAICYAGILAFGLYARRPKA